MIKHLYILLHISEHICADTCLIICNENQVWQQVATTKSGDWILRVAVALGLRRLSESSKRVIGLAILCAMQGVTHARNMNAQDRLAFVQSVKVPFKRLAHAMGPPKVWIQVLPASPDDLKEAHPEVYEATYTDLVPMANPLQCTDWTLLVDETKVRKERGSLAPSISLGAPASSAHASNQLLDFGMSMQRQMLELQQQIAALRGGGPTQAMLADARPPAPSGLQIALPDRAGGAHSTVGQLCLPGFGAAPGFGAPSVPEAPPSKKAKTEEAAIAECETPLAGAPDASATDPPSMPAPAGGRLSVRAATEAILKQMGDKKDAEKVAKVAVAAPVAKGKGKGLHKSASYTFKVLGDCVQCFYIVLPCKKYPYKGKKELEAAKKAAEDFNVPLGETQPN